MTNAVPLRSRLYGRLLVLYPEDLRRDYGVEMALAFAEDLDTARRDAGLRGVIRVWRCALVEFMRFALPGCASSPAFRVPAISVAFSVGIMGISLVGAARCDQHSDGIRRLLYPDLLHGAHSAVGDLGLSRQSRRFAGLV